jgi:hypothetical protein
MKIETRATTVLSIILVALWAFAPQAFAQKLESSVTASETAGPGMPIPGAETGPRWMIPPTLLGQINMWERVLLFQKDRFGLNLDQMDRIGLLLNEQRKYIIQKNAQMEILLIDIQEFLLKDPADLKKTQEKVRELETLSGDMTMEQIRVFNKALDVLATEQRKQALDFFRQWIFTRTVRMD